MVLNSVWNWTIMMIIYSANNKLEYHLSIKMYKEWTNQYRNRIIQDLWIRSSHQIVNHLVSNWNVWCPVITTYLSNSTCQVWLISTRVELVGSTTLLRSCVLISTYYMSKLVIKFIYIIMIFFMFDNWWLKDKKNRIYT